MSVNNKQVGLIIGAVVVVGVGSWLIFRPKTLGYTGPSGGPAPAPPPSAGNPLGGSQVYSKMPLQVRSSPHTNDPLWGLLGGNVIFPVSSANIYLGTIIGQKSDTDGDTNPDTTAPYIWYQVNMPVAKNSTGAGPFFVREDFITIK